MRNFLVLVLVLVLISGVSAYSETASIPATTLNLPIIEGGNLILESSTYDPVPAEPGNYLDVYVVVKNMGNKEMKNFYIVADPTYPFYLMGTESGAESISQMSSGREKLVDFRLMIDDQALSGSYNLNIKVCEDEFCEDEVKKIVTTISVNTGGKPKLEIGIDDYEVFTPGTLGEVIITAVNKGKLGIQFLTIDMINTEDYDIISTPRKYLGELETNDFERETYQVYINPKIKTSKEISILLNVEYSDDNYKTYQTQEEVKFNVYTENDAQKIGLIKSSSFGKITILFLILAFITYRWMRKRKS
jgi:hypothetical protein